MDISKVETLLPSLEAPNNCVDRHRINLSQSLTELKEQILNQNIITCDQITWSFFGLSAATINSILLILLLLINIILLRKYYYNNEKN